jgi:2-polyprenyl-3-methyl-5-hydroxy-6-metoxy-1,4-benzoquinol methylase
MNKKLQDKITLFSPVVEFSSLHHVDGALFSTSDQIKVPRTASNSIGTGRKNLTAISFELVTELFIFEQLMENLSPDEFVVDVGCGEPVLFNMMANSMFFPKYIGLDIRSEALSLFGNNSNCIVINCDLNKNMVIKENTVKIAVLSEVLEHLDEVQGFHLLQSIHSILKPEGTLLLTTPIKPVGVDIDMSIEDKKWNHVTYYEYPQLIKILSRTGFKVQRHYFNKFMGRRTTYKTVRDAMIKQFGEVGGELFDHIKSVWSRRIASSVFGHFAGDVQGHIQIIATKE